MQKEGIESAVTGRKVSRRWLLRSTASVTAASLAVGKVTFAAGEAQPADPVLAPDHDPVSGEIFDRERHHHWDTV